ncbi:MAG: hypothetical protein KC729_05060 [Candidatus Eisenbacteria bacterium]|uniref:NurA domain-containing protein n=1 Tax=Eiseniibacteriota bacterium TaxID=2212470 RepID=A0A956RP46_UNCEI|nr:hypothetical protein [Candidatus Eisenbacteria bacterium]
MRTRVFVDEWDPGYGSPYRVESEEPPSGRLVEDGSDLVMHPAQASGSIAAEAESRGADITRLDIGSSGLPGDGGIRGLAFVDGVRRAEATLFQVDEESGRSGRGVAGSHACGAVLVPSERSGATFGPTRVERVVIWGSGLEGTLPAIGEWSWHSVAIADESPDAPLRELQERMRVAEAELAEEMCAAGFLTIVDGPLHYVRSRDLPVVGYVKTHHRSLLPPEHHRRIPELLHGERSSLFAIGTDRYSTYLRLAPMESWSSPWTGIVRLEIPQSAGLEACVRLADTAASLLPRFAGVPHRDPRAPQNLQPVGALESHLRRQLGSPELARRAVRDAVARAATVARPR